MLSMSNIIVYLLWTDFFPMLQYKFANNNNNVITTTKQENQLKTISNCQTKMQLIIKPKLKILKTRCTDQNQAKNKKQLQ